MTKNKCKFLNINLKSFKILKKNFKSLINKSIIEN